MEYSTATPFTTKQIAELKEQGGAFRFVLLSIEGSERHWGFVGKVGGVDHVLVTHSGFSRRIFKSAKGAIELLVNHFPEIDKIELPISESSVEKMGAIKITFD